MSGENEIIEHFIEIKKTSHTFFSWCHKLVEFKPPPVIDSFSSINICVFKSSKIVSYNLTKE